MSEWREGDGGLTTGVGDVTGVGDAMVRICRETVRATMGDIKYVVRGSDGCEDRGA